MDFSPFAPNPMLLPARKKQSVGSVWVEHISHVGNPNRHTQTIGLSDGRQSRRSIEPTRPTLPNFQSNHWALGDDVQYRTQAIGPISLLECARKPKATIGPAYLGAILVNRTPLLAHVLMRTGNATQLIEFINSEKRATQRARSTHPGARTAFGGIH